MQAALLLLDLQLGECAQKALQAASKQQADQEQPSSTGLELALCCSRAASLGGDHEGGHTNLPLCWLFYRTPHQPWSLNLHYLALAHLAPSMTEYPFKHDQRCCHALLGLTFIAV